MKFLLDTRYSILMNRPQILQSAQNVTFVAAAAFIFWMLITAVENITFSSETTWTFVLLSFLIYVLEYESVRFVIGLFSTWGVLISSIFDILVSLISCGVMLSLTSFVLHKLWRFRGFMKKKAERRCRVRSCLWTRRKVLWLQSGLSRSEYVLKALRSSMNARANWGKKAHKRNEGMFFFMTAVSELREIVRKIRSFSTRSAVL